MKIAFVLFEGFSALDFDSLYEPLTRLKSMHLMPELQWELCATTETVISSHGWKVNVDRKAESLSDYDLLVIPGAVEVENLISDKGFMDWLSAAGAAPWIGTVGKGSLLLAAAGLLSGKRVAAQTELFESLEQYGVIALGKPLLEDDAIFTAASSNMALKLGISLCAQLAGFNAAEQVRQALGVEAEHSLLANDLFLAETRDSREGPRFSRVIRKTKETSIEVELFLDGNGENQIATGVPFLDHMLTQIAVHGLFDLNIQAQGDLELGPHHTIEDVALALGEAFRKALGNRQGVVRLGAVLCPMDDTLARVVVDLSGRPYAVIHADWNLPYINNVPTTMIPHFLESFASQVQCNLHAAVLYGRDDHHQAEAVFKALGRALDAAVQIDPRRTDIASSKGPVQFSES
ncbi:MAG: imidazoleglycerol-phosphate dehydratase HisB [Anaerolineaceae bacterium]|nr:imidazoleglycerol-phosphate dehydratase HisB [Anaerolineaceae bacterium]